MSVEPPSLPTQHSWASADELAHPLAPVEEWVFTCWHGAELGMVSGYRIHRSAPGMNWYWCALVRRGAPMLHVSEWAVPPRRDPLLVKAAGLWAEHTCDAPFEQWTVANETYAAALDDPDEALGRGYGVPTALSWDLEWYATAPPRTASTEGSVGTAGLLDGYQQAGVVHGTIELGDGSVDVAEVAGHRWHRWGATLGPISLPRATAHTGLQAPFRFPDGAEVRLVLTPDGWRALVGDGGLPQMLRP